MTTYTAPAWVFLLLIITSIPQFIKLYRWLRRSDSINKPAKPIQVPTRPQPGSEPQPRSDHKFTDSMITTVGKIKSVAQSAGEAASGGFAAAAKKFEQEMGQTAAPKPSPLNNADNKDEAMQCILKKLFQVGDTGRLPQSVASDLGLSAIKTNSYLKELTESNLVAKRKTTLGDTYFITKMGRAFCEKQGYEK